MSHCGDELIASPLFPAFSGNVSQFVHLAQARSPGADNRCRPYLHDHPVDTGLDRIVPAVFAQHPVDRRLEREHVDPSAQNFRGCRKEPDALTPHVRIREGEIQ